MKRFVNKLRRRIKISQHAEGGYTLIELIATLALLSVVMGVIYSSITFGLNTYNKIRIENTLRDEGDLLMSSIISELYRVGPSRISQLQTNGNLRQSIVLMFPEVVSDDDSNSGGTSLQEGIAIKPNDSGKHALFINDREIAIESIVVPNAVPLDLGQEASTHNDSFIRLKCLNDQSGCSSGMLEIKLKLRQAYSGNCKC
ncbi:type II secretion system protein J [Paenibacillus sp. CF384]|uniref:PulJ/GspJ family protein n=1 Tax=Paenibacillus sp. CF384 TaxID=1884382 RepID=UPI00089674BC|nr:prepilin-type N-terminal cleavage/methylation domain-containing protein [Paenibacillus sp. CF384]SDX96436.1 prepilin-type N-terminal cleavage/methylation domain-containing protein [Paenibacillus sp. CF384]